MSHYMTALAMKQKGLKPAAKIVLYWLADHHNGETGDCFPSIARLAEVCEMSKRSVQMQIDELERLGLVSVSQRTRENSSQTSNSYILTFKENYGEPETSKGGVQNLQGGRAEFAGGRVQNLLAHNLVNNNLGNLTLFPDDFEDLWKLYPRKEGKGAAKKEYANALKKVSAQQLLSAIEQYTQAVKGKDVKYIPHLRTWLSQERWADDVPVSAGNVDTNFRSMVNDLARVQR